MWNYRDDDDDEDAKSDTSSISQTSYDPNRPDFRGMSAEISESLPTTVDEDSGITLISSKPKPESDSGMFNTGVWAITVLFHTTLHLSLLYSTIS